MSLQGSNPLALYHQVWSGVAVSLQGSDTDGDSAVCVHVPCASGVVGSDVVEREPDQILTFGAP